MEGTKVEGCDLLDGKTGPKVFFECGVGRLDRHGRWHIVNGLLRLGKRGAKKSVTRKRVDRLTGRVVDLYVSKIRHDNGAFEVSTSEEQVREIMEAEKEMERKGEGKKKVSVSSLKEGQELTGTVVRVEPYGALIDVGANRHGLLHIKRVRKLLRQHIDKKEGLIEAGLERGAQLMVTVRSVKGKDVSLDFTEEKREEKREERRARRREARERKRAREKKKLESGEKKGAEVTAASASAAVASAAGEKGNVVASISDIDEKEDEYEIPDGYADISEDEAAAWAAYGAGDDDDADSSGAMSDDDAADWAAFAAGGDDFRDEDDDIEDALGISTY